MVTQSSQAAGVTGVWVLVTPAWISLHSAMNHENHETRSQSLTSSCARSTFCFCLQRVVLLFAACWSFVCSVRKFCLQRVVLLFAAWWSFVCSVLEFCLQCAGVLFAACNSFACSVHVFFYSFFCLQGTGDDLFDVLFYVCKEFFYLQCFLFAKAVAPVGHLKIP